MHYTSYQGAQERQSTSRAADPSLGRSLHEPQSSSQDASDSAGFWGSPHASDFYLSNQLHSYSFGTAPRISNSHPAAAQDEAELEELNARADITPRPSVVAYSYQPLPRTTTWRDPGSGVLTGDSPHRTQANAPNSARDRANDSAPSSASASVTSFNDSLYAGSAVSQDSSSVPHTPINEFTSSEEDEDRSLRSDFSISGPYPSSSANASTTSMEFSEEEYDSDDVPDFEISSARVASVDMSFQEEEYSIYTQERRGSLPMVIPGTPSISGQYHFGRDRADNLVTIRRPSRSLDDDLSMIEAMRNHSSRTRPDGDSLPSPVSMPGSEGDWRNLNARVMRRGSATQTTGSFYDYSDASSQKQPSSSKAIDVGEFDLDWANLRNGIVSMDQTELGDIVRPPARPSGSSRWFPRFGGSSNQSTDYARRPSVATISSFGSDTFGKAVFRWGGEGYQSQRHDWTFKHEKTATIAHQIPVTSGNATARGFSGFLGSKPPEDDRKKSHKEREKEKDRISKVMASWRGMPIDSQEIWKMDLIGRFKVERRATKTTDLAKGPQQRVIVHRLREMDHSPFHAYTVPTSTVHKHSKAVAFSIGRYYRRKTDNKEKPKEVNSGGPLLTASHPPAPPSESQNRHGSMALLAPRRVQIAFTNTTSTRKLESHGLLDEDQPRKAIREHDHIKRDRERDKRDKNKGKARDKQPSGRKQEAAFGEASERGLLASFASSSAVNLSGSSRATNASGSASVMTSTTMVSSSSIPSTPSSLSADLNASSSHVSTLAVASGKSITNLSTNRPRRRRRVHDPLELDEDDDYDDDGLHSPSTRTPHSETYGTVDASLIEQLYQERAQQELETASVFKKLFRSRNNKANVGAATGHLEANYVPPWILLPSRSRQEQQQRVVENLNSSFMDVGLLPSTHRTRKQSQTSKKRRDDQSNGILSEVPEESLYMLLPLWPGETDPISAQAHPHLLRRIPPTDCRQYLLIYYRSMDSRKKGDKKKRASPTADYERSDRTILLSSFHISARFVAHNELIGTGIRVPEEGLTISGPLDYAWETLPSAEVREDCKSDWVIGVCHCRESGIEFIPEGLVKMDLCQMSWKPPSAVNDKYIPPEPTLKLTPIGQAVVEMAWLGALALTSFGQVGLV